MPDKTTTVKPTPKKIATPKAKKPIDEVEEATEAFGVRTVRANADGKITGLKPNEKYHILGVNAGGNAKRAVQIPPAANLTPPRVRRSLLIVVESDEPDRNPVSTE